MADLLIFLEEWEWARQGMIRSCLAPRHEILSEWSAASPMSCSAAESLHECWGEWAAAGAPRLGLAPRRIEGRDPLVAGTDCPVRVGPGLVIPGPSRSSPC
jgi:hypothetical protein